MSVLQGRTIFLLEDEYIIALDAENILTEMGAEVVIASDLAAARRGAAE